MGNDFEEFPRETLVGVHFVEHEYLDQLIDQLHLLETFERNVMLGSENDTMEDVRRIKETLRRQRNAVLSSQKRFSPFRYERNVSQLLFSFVRIREFVRSPKDFARTIANDVLGDELFDLDMSKCDWIHVGSDRFSRLQLFRDFVLLSFYISEKSADPSGNVSYVIENIENERLVEVMRRRGFKFVSTQGKWTLLWARFGVVKDPLEEFALIPQIEGITCISDKRSDLTGVVHLSSDFSMRRREIFRRGEMLRGAHLVVGEEFIVVDKSHAAAILEGK